MHQQHDSEQLRETIEILLLETVTGGYGPGVKNEAESQAANMNQRAYDNRWSQERYQDVLGGPIKYRRVSNGFAGLVAEQQQQDRIRAGEQYVDPSQR